MLRIAIVCDGCARTRVEIPWPDKQPLRALTEADVGITTAALRIRMAGRSPQWDALLPHWDELDATLADEIATRTDGRAPDTYASMCTILDGVS